MKGYQIGDADIEAIPVPLVADALDTALKALGRGEITNPPRVETLGRAGDPDFLRLEMDATWYDRPVSDTEPVVEWRSRKIIEESGARDEKGRRILGDRRAWIELSDIIGHNEVTVEAETITNLRTGVTALLAARYLMPERPVTLAVVGTGRIARTVVLTASHVLGVDAIRVYSRREENRASFVDDVGPGLGCPLTACSSVEECVTGAEVVVAAVPSPEPVILAEMTRSTAHVTLVGGDPRVILGDTELWRQRHVIVDNAAQAEKTGDLLRAVEEGSIEEVRWAKEDDDQILTLADAALGQTDHLRDKPTLAILTGMASMDLALARLAWERMGRNEKDRSL
jgi:ornithine cyclodeaminase/alanine dehydrogenase-like protein (mu-crystallin family)